MLDECSDTFCVLVGFVDGMEIHIYGLVIFVDPPGRLTPIGYDDLG